MTYKKGKKLSKMPSWAISILHFPRKKQNYVYVVHFSTPGLTLDQKVSENCSWKKLREKYSLELKLKRFPKYSVSVSHNLGSNCMKYSHICPHKFPQRCLSTHK